MNTIKTILASFTILFSAATFAQDAVQLEEATKIKKYTLISNGDNMDYQIKVETNKIKPIGLEPTDSGMTNQERINYPNKVIKWVSIDADMDGDFEKMLELKYVSRADDSFSITPNKDGFVVSVIGKKLYYNVLDADYNLDSKTTKEFSVKLRTSSK